METKKKHAGGRPKGSFGSPRFADYISMAERKKFVEFILDTYMGDMRIAQWMGDHLFIKPKQEMEITGKDGAPLNQPSDKVQELAQLLLEAHKNK